VEDPPISGGEDGRRYSEEERGRGVGWSLRGKGRKVKDTPHRGGRRGGKVEEIQGRVDSEV
jgi:hypothetical protein